MNSHNIKIFLSLTPSHLLKVTKFLVKISHFKFLVTFYVKLQKRITPLFPATSPLETEILSSHPLFENLVGGSIPPPLPFPSRKKRGFTLCNSHLEFWLISINRIRIKKAESFQKYITSFFASINQLTLVLQFFWKYE